MKPLNEPEAVPEGIVVGAAEITTAIEGVFETKETADP
jgi:hypothetical protein